jgi:hypothetical protein
VALSASTSTDVSSPSIRYDGRRLKRLLVEVSALGYRLVVSSCAVFPASGVSSVLSAVRR